MVSDYPNWREDAAQFLAENLPKASDHPGWQDMASTAYQVGCMALVKLGFADATDWGAIPKDPPEQPATAPRWDDICISVLWLANQQNKLSFRLPDGSLPPTRIGNGLVIAMKDPPPPPTPNIAARFGLGCALCDPDFLLVLERLGLISDGSWRKEAEFILWRTSPKNWTLNYLSDKRFLEAVQKAVATIPADIADKILDLIVIEETHIDELINRRAETIVEGREKYGPKAHLGEVPSRKQAQRSLEFHRRDALDWLFFRRWRIDDGWLSETGAESAIEVFHDRLAISMRKSVLKHLHPTKPQYFE